MLPTSRWEWEAAVGTFVDVYDFSAESGVHLVFLLACISFRMRVGAIVWKI